MSEHTQTILANEGPAWGNCFQAAVASALDLPMDAVPHFILFEDEWLAALKLWLATREMRFGIYAIEEEIGEAPVGLIGLGKSHRGNGHAVVWRDGACIWDPHPDRTGLVGPVQFIAIFTKEQQAL